MLREKKQSLMRGSNGCPVGMLISIVTIKQIRLTVLEKDLFFVFLGGKVGGVAFQKYKCILNT